MLLTLRGKTILMYKNYTYSYKNPHTTRYLRCSRRLRGQCKSILTLNKEGKIVKSTEHNHPPPAYRISEDDVTEFIPSNRGKGSILVYRGYTFANMNNKTRWYCSKKGSGCKVRLLTTLDGKVLHSQHEHNHIPPNLYRASDGQLFRLNF